MHDIPPCNSNCKKDFAVTKVLEERRKGGVRTTSGGFVVTRSSRSSCVRIPFTSERNKTLNAKTDELITQFKKRFEEKHLVVILIHNGGKDHRQHRCIHLYAAACGIGTTSYENILCNIRNEDSNLDNVNVNKWTDVDHGFHRLMMSGNSILVLPDGSSRQTVCAQACVRKQVTGDWCLALTKRYYNCGN